MSQVGPRYYLELGGAFALYAAVLAVTVSQRGAITDPPLAAAVEMAPVLPLILVFWAILRQYGRFDELYKRIHAEAFALGAMILGWGATVWGFAENAGMPPLPTIWIGPGLIAFWGLCLPLVVRRYK